MDARESSETENAIHWEQHTVRVPFSLFTFLAYPALAYRKFNTGSFNKQLTQRERGIVNSKEQHDTLEVLKSMVSAPTMCTNTTSEMA